VQPSTKPQLICKPLESQPECCAALLVSCAVQEGKLGDMQNMLQILSDLGRTDTYYFKQQVRSTWQAGARVLCALLCCSDKTAPARLHCDCVNVWLRHCVWLCRCTAR
jgi:hypothetical protein